MGTQNNLDSFHFTPGAVFDSDRFDLPDLGLVVEPTFTIRQTDRVFTMGSCFAQRILAAMKTAGFDATDGGLDLKYNVMSMLQETRWSLQGTFDRTFVTNTSDGRWFNGHRHPGRPKNSLEEALAPHLMAQRAAGKALCVADVIVLTFGLTEAWRDEVKSVWLNETPPKSVVDFEKRYSVHCLTHSQCFDGMVQLITNIQSVNPRAKFVCSISPVPLKATFFGNDILISNMHSKCTQRSALQEALGKLRSFNGLQVDYFPSFELAWFAPRRDEVWVDRFPDGRRDGRHIRPEFIQRAILPLFLQAYVPSMSARLNPVQSSAKYSGPEFGIGSPKSSAQTKQ